MIPYKRIDHLQICIPPGTLEKGREFYCDILGFREIEMPEMFKDREVFWCTSGEIELHIGTEPQGPLSQRHPAFEVEDLLQTRTHLESKGVFIKDTGKIPGRERFSIVDSWGNKIEFLEKE